MSGIVLRYVSARASEDRGATYVIFGVNETIARRLFAARS